MFNSTRIRIFAFACLCIALPFQARAQSVQPPQAVSMQPPSFVMQPGRMIDVGGYKLNLYCMGQGKPTVMMLSGGAWGAVAWAEVQPKLARHTRVCSYDRAGMNFSEVGPVKRRVDQDVTDLRALLERAAIEPPYVLVGWSAGGMLGRWYVNLHPREVAGLVTVDGSDFDYWESSAETPWLDNAIRIFHQCRDAARSGEFARDSKSFERCTDYGNPLTFSPALRKKLEPTLRNPDLYAQWSYDLEQIHARAQALRGTRRSYGDMPLRVLVAGYHFDAALPPGGARGSAPDAAFIAHSYQIAGLSTQGQLIGVPQASHAIHFDHAQDVIDVIDGVVGQIRTPPAGRPAPRLQPEQEPASHLPSQRQAERWADEQVAAVVRSAGATAAAATVVSGGKVLVARSYGWFDPVKKIPIGPDDQFMVGSITKTFTSLVIAQLQARGRIQSLDDPANRYLKRYRLPRAFGKEVTIAQLATHTAGLESPGFGLAGGQQREIPASAEFLRRRLPQIVREPGSKSVYANFGPPILGALAEDLTGERFDRLMEEWVLRPLGMRDTVLGYDPGGSPRLVYAGLTDGKTVRYARRMINDPMTAPAGSVQTTPADMALFMNALLGHTPAVLSADLLAEQRKPRAVNYPGLSPVGLGVFLDPWNRTTLVGHGGLIAGFRSNMVIVPQSDFGVFVVYSGGKDLFDGGPGNAGAATDALLKEVLGPVIARPAARTSDVHKLEGRYWIELRAHTTAEAMADAGRMIEVKAKDGDLLIGGAGDAGQRFVEVAPGLFQGSAENGTRPPLYGFEPGRILANKLYGTRVAGLQDPRHLIQLALAVLALVLSGALALFMRSAGRVWKLACALAGAVVFFTLVWPVTHGTGLDAELLEGTDWRFRVTAVAAWMVLAASLACLLSAFRTLRRSQMQRLEIVAAAHGALVGLAGLILVIIAHVFHVM